MDINHGVFLARIGYKLKLFIRITPWKIYTPVTPALLESYRAYVNEAEVIRRKLSSKSLNKFMVSICAGGLSQEVQDFSRRDENIPFN